MHEAMFDVWLYVVDFGFLVLNWEKPPIDDCVTRYTRTKDLSRRSCCCKTGFPIITDDLF